MEQETIVRIKWGSGSMEFIAEKYFPITAEKMTKLYKKCIRYDWEHQEQVVQQILESLNYLKEKYTKQLEADIEYKNRKADELARAVGRANKKICREQVNAANEAVKATNQTLKQVQKNIELLTLLSTAKK